MASEVVKVADFRKMPMAGHTGAWQLFKGRHKCLHHAWNTSLATGSPGCGSEWEHLAKLCWPPTPRGHAVKVPCPDDGFLNPQQFVYRYCTNEAKWYVNETFNSGRPYSDFYDCFLPRARDADENLRKHANAQTVMILKTLYDHRLAHSVINSVSFALLIVALIICFLQRRKTKSDGQHFKFSLFIIAIFALLANQITSMSTKLFYDSSYIIKCRVSKSIVSLSNILFCECLFATVFHYISILMQYRWKRKMFNKILVLILAVAGFIVFVQILLEVVVHNNHCGFGTSQSTYHWVITAPKFCCLACTFCLDSVVIHSVFVLRPKHLQETRQLRALRVSSICLFIMAIVNLCSEVFLSLLHHYSSAKESSQATIHFYSHAFSATSTSRGIFFSFLMCYLDSQTYALLCCKPLDEASAPRRNSGQNSGEIDEQAKQDFCNPVRSDQYSPGIATSCCPDTEENKTNGGCCGCGGDEGMDSKTGNCSGEYCPLAPCSHKVESTATVEAPRAGCVEGNGSPTSQA